VQASNKGTVVNKNDDRSSDNINSDYRTISMPNLGKRKISGYLAMISVVDRSNSDDATKIVPPSSCGVSCYVCAVLGAQIDYQLCRVCPSVRPHGTTRLNLKRYV
jgi:hypothetical protein